jgi:hypothetical protein
MEKLYQNHQQNLLMDLYFTLGNVYSLESNYFNKIYENLDLLDKIVIYLINYLNNIIEDDKLSKFYNIDIIKKWEQTIMNKPVAKTVYYKISQLSEEDKEDIMSKFEEDETEDFGQEDDMGGEDMTDDSEVEDIQADMDVPVEGYEMEEENYGNGAIFDSIFGESKVDKVISKYFEVSKKEIREGKEKQIQETAKKKAVVNQIMESVVKMTETIEQELAAKKFIKENLNSKFVGITNKKNLVFETKTGQVRITPNGDLI